MSMLATIHYPEDERAQRKIKRDAADFLCAAAARYIESLSLSDEQIEMLLKILAEEML